MKSLNRFLNRIICGDALQVLKDIPDRSADLIITDPPYGDNTSYGTLKRSIVGNEHPLIGLMALAEAYRILKQNTVAYMFCGIKHLTLIKLFFTMYTRYNIREVVIWDKISMGMGYGFRKQYECILVLEKGKPAYRNHSMLNVLRFKKVPTPDHPHTKPTDLIEKLIEHSSKESDVILDPFVGSGAIPLATRNLCRQFIGIEIEPRYCRLAEEELRKAGCQKPSQPPDS
jgi:site-specific DNA-methyltransferase (adenine-specific)